MWRDPHRMRVSWLQLHTLQLRYPQINRVEMRNGSAYLPLDPSSKSTGLWWK